MNVSCIVISCCTFVFIQVISVNLLQRSVDPEIQKNWLKWEVKLLQQRNEGLSKSFPQHC